MSRHSFSRRSFLTTVGKAGMIAGLSGNALAAIAGNRLHGDAPGRGSGTRGHRTA